MHSSRMHTTHSSSNLLGEGVCLSACWDTNPPLGVGLETPQTPQLPPGCGPGDPLIRPLNFPPGCGPGDPPGQTPQLLPWVWAWRPPWPDPSTSHLGVGLETALARPVNFPPGPGDLKGMLGYHFLWSE